MTYEPSENLIDQYREMHEKGWFEGQSLLGHAYKIGRLVAKYRAQSLLDYGCGKGWQYTRWNAQAAWGGLMPALYDPATEYSTKPSGTFVGVICTDVAEHVPKAEVDAFLADVIGYAHCFVYFAICGRPAGKNLPDGRNSHLTLEPRAWWLHAIHNACERLDRWPEIVLEYEE